MPEVTRPPSTGSYPLEIDYLHAIWEVQKALLIATTGGTGGASVGTRLQFTVGADNVTVSNAGLVGVAISKICYILRGTAVVNITTGAASIGTLQFNSGAGSLTAEASEPFLTGEKITVIILA